MTKEWSWKMGSAYFKDNKLYVGVRTISEIPKYRPDLCARRLIIINTDLRAWCVNNDGKQNAISIRDIKLKDIFNIAKSTKDDKFNPYKLWVEAVGKSDVRLACRFKESMFILKYIKRVDGFKALCKRFPQLAYMVMFFTTKGVKVKDSAFRKLVHNFNKAMSLIKLSDKDILNRMLKDGAFNHRFKNRSSVIDVTEISGKFIKALKKFRPASCLGFYGCRQLYELLTKCKTVLHLPILNAVVVNTLKQHPELPFSIAMDLAVNGNKKSKTGNIRSDYSLVSMHLADIDRLYRAISEAGDKPVKMTLKTAKDLKTYHDELTVQYTKIQDRPVDFCEPPFKGTENIVPITNSTDLKIEGTRMHHCVGGYKEAVLSGTSYIYHTQLDKDCGTLELYRKSDGGWMLNQHRSVCNKEPSKELKKLVSNWCKQNNISDNEGILF